MSVIAVLEEQHDHIEELLARIPTVTGSVREQAFLELRRLFAVHEAVEQQLLHPKAADDEVGEPASRVGEEQSVASLLTRLEVLDIESTEFETMFHGLRDAARQHAEAEELTEFAQLQDAFDGADADRIRAAVSKVESQVDAMQVPFAAMQTFAETALRESR